MELAASTVWANAFGKAVYVFSVCATYFHLHYRLLLKNIRTCMHGIVL